MSILDMKFFDIISAGFKSIGSAYAPRDYIRPQVGDFRKDAENIQGDFRKVGTDMRKAIGKAKHVKRTHNR